MKGPDLPSITERELAAYHEAGHAVIAALQLVQKRGGVGWKQGESFESATIRPRKTYDEIGHLITTTTSGRELINYLVALAGPYAEHLWNDDESSWFQHGISDFDICTKIEKEKGLNESESCALRKECADLVERAKPAIEDVAQDLLDKGTVTQHEVKAYCKKHNIKNTYWNKNEIRSRK